MEIYGGLEYFVLPIIIYLCEVEGSTPRYVENHTGVCHNYGQDSYKCEMSGNFDGTCTETLTHSVCDCNGTSETSIITANYWRTGSNAGTQWFTSEGEKVCDGMTMRCKDGNAGYSVARKFLPYTTCHQRRKECQTVGGPDQGRPCMFPFKFQGKIYNECPVAHLEDPSKTWCSTMGGNHVAGQKKWGYCSSSCPVSNEKEVSLSGQESRNECQTVGGPDPGKSCIFPFQFQDKIYNECPFDPDDQSKTWCSTKVDSNGNHVVGQKKWGHCSASCPETDKKETYFSGFEDYEADQEGIVAAPVVCASYQIDESWCESAKPDCKTSSARISCPKYCGECQEETKVWCENKESWCEAARPDCSMPTTRENCQKYCGLCGASSYPLTGIYNSKKKTKLCNYSCKNDGGCEVQYTGPPRRGQILGSCFPPSFRGSCSGTPRECNDCNQVLNCYEPKN